MKLAVMQPYAFPYIAYFQLIQHVDKWVVFDDIQFRSKGWINRNRILHPDLNKEWQYITVPLKKHSRETKIIDIEINDNHNWRNKILGQLTAYRRKAPYYKETVDFVGDCISFQTASLSEWVIHTLEKTCNYLGIPFKYLIFSKMKLSYDNIKHAGQWALDVASNLSAHEYVNPIGGYELFDENEFAERKIKLRFLKPNLTPYIQRIGHFVSGLSIIDVMMWNNKDSINKMLSDYSIVKSQEINISAL